MTRCYAARHKDSEVVRRSSSGGIFTVLSQEILKCGGSIVCSVYNYAAYVMEFRMLTDISKLDFARRLKYIQIVSNNIYDDVLKWLKANPAATALFIVTGCQA